MVDLCDLPVGERVYGRFANETLTRHPRVQLPSRRTVATGANTRTTPFPPGRPIWPLRCGSECRSFNINVVAVCLNVCRVPVGTPAAFRWRVNSRDSVSGRIGPPSGSQNTRSWSRYASPAKSRSSSCVSRCRWSASTVSGSSATVRFECADFGGPNDRQPATTQVERPPGQAKQFTASSAGGGTCSP